MSLGSSIYKLTFDSNAKTALEPTRREIQLSKKIMEETRSATERYGDSLDSLNQLLNKDLITTQDYNRAVAELRSELPEQKAAAEAAAEAQRQLNADMERGKQISKATQTETEQYAEEMADLNRMLRVGAITEKDMARETQRLKVQLLGAENATDKLSDAMREGRAMTRSLMTSEEKRAEELRRTRQLLATGAISQETYNRKIRMARMEQMQSLPVIGQMTSRFMGIHPAALLAGAGIGVMAVGLRVAMGVARSLTQAVQEQMKEMDELAKSSRTLGMDTSSLIALTDLVGEASGGDFGMLEKSLQQMTRRLSEAATGTGTAKDALDELNLSAAELNAMSVVDKYKTIADAIAGVSSESDQARLAYDLFGRAGIEMLNTLRLGGDALEKAEARAKELGVTFSELDKLSIERANDQLGDITDVMKGITRGLTADLAPALIMISEEFVTAFKPGTVLGDELRAGLELIPPIIGWAVDKTKMLVGTMQLVVSVARGAAAGIMQAAVAIDYAAAAMNPFREANQELKIMADEMARIAAVGSADGLVNITAGARGDAQARIEAIKAELAAAAAANKDKPVVDVEVEIEAREAADKLAADVKSLTEALQEQIDTLGMTSDEAARHKVKGADPGQLAEIERLQNILDFQRELDKADKDRIAREEQIASAVKGTTEALELKLATMRMSSDEQEQHRLKELGAEPDQIKEIKRLQDLVNARQEEMDAEKKASDLSKSLTDDMDNYTKELEKQIATRGKSADEIKLWELAQRGATDTELEKIKALQAEAAATEELTSAMQTNFDAAVVGERSTMEGLAKARQAALADSFGKGDLDITAPMAGDRANRVAGVRKDLDDMLGRDAGSTPPMGETGLPRPVVTIPVSLPQPMVPQPAQQFEEMKKQTKLQEKIAAGVKKPIVIEIEEVTL